MRSKTAAAAFFMSRILYLDDIMNYLRESLFDRWHYDRTEEKTQHTVFNRIYYFDPAAGYSGHRNLHY